MIYCIENVSKYTKRCVFIISYFCYFFSFNFVSVKTCCFSKFVFLIFSCSTFNNLIYYNYTDFFLPLSRYSSTIISFCFFISIALCSFDYIFS